MAYRISLNAGVSKNGDSLYTGGKAARHGFSSEDSPMANFYLVENRTTLAVASCLTRAWAGRPQSYKIWNGVVTLYRQEAATLRFFLIWFSLHCWARCASCQGASSLLTVPLYNGPSIRLEAASLLSTVTWGGNHRVPRLPACIQESLPLC